MSALIFIGGYLVFLSLVIPITISRYKDTMEQEKRGESIFIDSTNKSWIQAYKLTIFFKKNWIYILILGLLLIGFDLLFIS